MILATAGIIYYGIMLKIQVAIVKFHRTKHLERSCHVFPGISGNFRIF